MASQTFGGLDWTSLAELANGVLQHLDVLSTQEQQKPRSILQLSTREQQMLRVT